MGQDNGKSINVANSFAVPFEEDDRDPKTWFLDHDYIESMMEMCKKVNGQYLSGQDSSQSSRWSRVRQIEGPKERRSYSKLDPSSTLFLSTLIGHIVRI